MTANQLVEWLRTDEVCDILLNPYHSNPRGFDLYFVPKVFSISVVNNISVIATWAEAHKHSLILVYDTFKKAIVIKVNRLFPENTYPPEDLLK